jgi:hypothetical protein
MPVRTLLPSAPASRVLLEGVVDYAGLYPPAALDLRQAVRNYAHYRAGGHGWMLGRFVCGAAHLEEFSTVAEPFLPRDAGAIPWRVSVVSSGDAARDAEGMAEFNARHRVCFDECGAVADAYEVRADSTDTIERVAAQLPAHVTIYFEIAAASTTTLVPVIARAQQRAKLRTGGVTPEAFPKPEEVIAFLRCCQSHHVPAKATAGLHHPVAGEFPLTYAADAPRGAMYGFLNVLIASAVVALDADRLATVPGASPVASDAQLVALLSDRDATHFTVTDEQVRWGSPAGVIVLDRLALKQAREQSLVSFGSCSFTEPTSELRALAWLP